MARDSTLRILGVAFCLSLVCSVLVSVAAIGLKEQQERNKASEKKRNILQIAGLYDPTRPVEEQFARVKARSVDLETGRFAPLASGIGKSSCPRCTPSAFDAMAMSMRSLMISFTPDMEHSSFIWHAVSIISMVDPCFWRNWIASAPPMIAILVNST